MTHSRRSLALLMLCLAVLPSTSQAKGVAALDIGLRRGTIVRMTNLLTRERYASPGRDIPLAGVYCVDGARMYSTAEKLQTRAAGGSLQTATWDGGATTCSTRFSTDALGDIVVTQEATASRGSLYGVSWGVAGIPDSLDVLVPGESGQRLTAASDSGIHTFEYPTTWEAPFVIIQGARGGVIIRAEDTNLRFKALSVEYAGGSFSLRFETRNQAPFADRRSIQSVTWKISAYKGGWQAGAEVYRRWMRTHYAVTPIERKRPLWARDIRFAVTMKMDIDTLRELATRVNPRQTLVYIPDWRRDGFDRNYPDYTPSPEFPEFVRAAHRLGYRVMAHANYFGCDPNHPAFAELSRYQLRDPFTGEPQWWNPPADPTIKFAYINPASAAWRRLFVEKMKGVVRECGVDALHIDQTLIAVNDANGLIDGMNSIQGNLQLHRDLQAALPDVAISGEGLNEVTSICETFAQRHEQGINLWNGDWNDRRLAQAHSISSYILTPYTIMYGYLGVPNPVSNPATFTAWRRAYERYGVIPTYPWPTADEISTPSPLAESVLNDARFFQERLPTPDFSHEWRPNYLFVYRLRNGNGAAYRADSGVRLETCGADAIPRTISRRIAGVSEVWTSGGSIPGWPAYDDRAMVGLDPERDYEWTSAPADQRSLHVSRMPTGRYKLSQTGIHPQFARFQFEGIGDTIELWKRTDGSSSGVVLADGSRKDYAGISFTDPSGATAQAEGDGISVHPPWRSAGGMYVAFTLKLPRAQSLKLNTGIALRPGAEGKSDGVTMKTLAQCEGETVAAEVTAMRESVEPIALDLSRFAGRTITLQFEIGPGPVGSASFDMARIVRPTIAADSRQQGMVEITSPDPIANVLTADGPARAHRIRRNTYTIGLTLPNTIVIPFAKPTPVTLPCDLLGMQPIVHAVSPSGIEGRTYDYSSVSVDQAICGGESRRVLSTHPPCFGRTVADYLLTLPKGHVRLMAATGLRQGAKSEGVMFSIRVNGKLVMQRRAAGDEGWAPVDIDLAPWAGGTALISFSVDALGSSAFDMAVWGEPRLVASTSENGCLSETAAF